MVDLHRHSEFSLFDGFGNAKDLAKIAKEKGLTSLGMSEHGNVNGWIKHYQACKEQEIKPILGVECYYQPTFDKDKKSYHLCLFAKDVKGYQNINRIIYKANRDNFYYTAKVTNKLLKRYHEGIICTSACIASYPSQAIVNGKEEKAELFVEKFSELFGDDFYIEIQPYKISEKGLQEKVNVELMQIADKYSVKTILTSDSHYGSKEDFDTYKKMHQIAKHDKIDVDSTYSERYMPTEKEIVNRFVDMHTNDFKSKVQCRIYAHKMIDNLEEIESKVDADIISKLEYKRIEFGVDDPVKVLSDNIVQGMKEKGVYKNKKYRQRVKKEFEVIKENGFADYFLVVQDYIKWAKEQGIKVGPGRGSVCNSVCAYLLGITEVDSVKYNLVFERFLRMDKKKMPKLIGLPL